MAGKQDLSVDDLGYDMPLKCCQILGIYHIDHFSILIQVFVRDTYFAISFNMLLKVLKACACPPWDLKLVSPHSKP